MLPGTFVMIDPIRDVAPDSVFSHHVSPILFVNRCQGGCTITKGSNDARLNTSSIPPMSGSFTLSEFQWADEVWDQTIACIREVYGPYNVQVVTEDPGQAFHHEAILAGTATELGLGPGIGGIAPAACQPLDNVISFSFANQSGNALEMCWTLAQESAHSFGLPNHVFDCADPMTYLGGCGQKFFRDKGLQCGRFEPEPCSCGGSVQNSHRELRAAFGDGTQPPPPDVSVLLPADGATVIENFPVFAIATDKRLVDRIELWINGTKYLEQEGHDYFNRNNDYNFNTPNHPDGYMTIEIKAFNDLGSEGIASIRVLKGAPCTNTDACFDGQSCNDGGCAFPPPTQAVGEECIRDEECILGLCSPTSGTRYCAVECTPTVSGACDDGFDCIASPAFDQGGFCYPQNAGGGGCCSVAGGHRHGELPLIAFGLFLGVIMVLRRRRA